MKKGLYGVTAILILIVGTWVASPYWMLYQLKRAYEQQQPDKISTYIDYQQVRQSLKPQIENALLLHLNADQQSQRTAWYKMIRGLLDSQISQSVLDSLVSNQTIQLLMQGKQLSQMIPHFDAPEQRRSAQNMLQANTVVYTDPKQNNMQVHYRAGYDAINDFSITLMTQDGKETQFMFKRVNGWSWKMTAIDLGLN